MRLPSTSAAVALLSIAAVSCGSSVSAVAPGCILVEDGWGPTGTTAIRVERVATGARGSRAALAFLPGGDALVTERPGRIRLLRGGVLEATPVATVPVLAEGEGGLLGIAADPALRRRTAASTRYATVEAGRTEPVNRVSRWVLSQPIGRSACVERVLRRRRTRRAGHARRRPDPLRPGRACSTSGAGDGREPRARAGARGALSGQAAARHHRTARRRRTATPLRGSAVSRAAASGTSQAFDFGWTARTHGRRGPRPERRCWAAAGGDEVNGGARGRQNLGLARRVAHARQRDGHHGADPWLVVEPRRAARRRELLPRGPACRGGRGASWSGSLGRAPPAPRSRSARTAGVREHEVYLQRRPARRPRARPRRRQQGPDGAVWATTSNCDGRGTCPAEKDVDGADRRPVIEAVVGARKTATRDPPERRWTSGAHVERLLPRPGA